MKTYFDSSAIIAAVVEEELHFPAASEALEKSRDGFTSTHSIAEVFATLTGGRLGIQLTPSEAGQLIDVNIIGRLSILELSTADYRTAVSDSERIGARGGAIYDMLHLQAARRGKARRIFTINVRHFAAFASESDPEITLPAC